MLFDFCCLYYSIALVKLFRFWFSQHTVLVRGIATNDKCLQYESYPAVQPDCFIHFHSLSKKGGPYRRCWACPGPAGTLHKPNRLSERRVSDGVPGWGGCQSVRVTYWASKTQAAAWLYVDILLACNKGAVVSFNQGTTNKSLLKYLVTDGCGCMGLGSLFAIQTLYLATVLAN